MNYNNNQQNNHNNHPNQPQLNQPQLNQWKLLIRNYVELRKWINNSLDQFKSQLQSLLFPIFINIYIDLKSQLENSTLTIARADFEQVFDVLDLDLAGLQVLSSSPLILRSVPKIFYCTFNEFDFPVVAPALSLSSNSFYAEFLASRFPIHLDNNSMTILFTFLENKKYSRLLNLVNERIRFLPAPDAHHEKAVDLTTRMFHEAVTEHYQRDFPEESRIFPDAGPKTRIDISVFKNELRNLDDFYKRSKDGLLNMLCYTLHDDDIATSYISTCGRIVCAGYDSGKLRLFGLDNVFDGFFVPNSEGKLDPPVGDSFTLVGHTGPVLALCLFPCNNYLVSGGLDGTVRLWSLPLRRTLAVYSSVKFPVYSLSVSPSGNYFCVGGKFGHSLMFSVRTVKPQRVFFSSSRGILKVDPDAQKVNLLLNPRPSFFDVTCVKFHHNGCYVFNGTMNRVLMYDIFTGATVRVFAFEKNFKKNYLETTTSLGVSHDGKTLAVGTNIGNVFVFEIETQSMIDKFSINSPVYCVTFSCDNNFVYASGGIVGVYDISLKYLRKYWARDTKGYTLTFGYKGIVNVLGIKNYS